MIEELYRERLLAVIRASTLEEGIEICRALAQGGMRFLEVTFSVPEAEKCISQIKKEFPKNYVGAGSVTSLSQAELVSQIGADFAVSPHFSMQLKDFFASKEIFYVPGSFTPTELVRSFQAGVVLHKVFPAEVYGPKGIRSLLAPLPFLDLMVTGGVHFENAKDFFDAGAKVICAGSQLISKQDVENKNWQALTETAAKWVNLCRMN